MSPRRSHRELSPATVQILLSLVREPLHGYGIKLEVERRTEGLISLGSGTLYQALQRLEQQGLIAVVEPPPAASDDARRGRFYALREEGRARLEAELELLERTVSSPAARSILGRGRA